jgi:nucleotide-binding universal stress UspA family protein
MDGASQGREKCGMGHPAQVRPQVRRIASFSSRRPGTQQKERICMYRKIIVPIAMDQLEHGESVLGIAEKLIDEGGEIILLNVVEDLNAYAQGYMIVDFPLEMIEESRRHAVKTLEALKTKHGINGRIEIRTGGAAGTINALAKEENADLVIIASHRPGLIDYFIGSTASRVVSHCPCAVLVDR